MSEKSKKPLQWQISSVSFHDLSHQRDENPDRLESKTNVTLNPRLHNTATNPVVHSKLRRRMNIVSQMLGVCGGRPGFVFIILVVYLVAGGLLFQFLEHDDREEIVGEATEEMEEERSHLLKSLWAETISRSEEDWIQVANDRMDMYENELRQYIEQGVDLQDEDDDNPWTLIGSVFYAFTVCTTIGYGNIYPVSFLGRFLTVIYGLIGIPLTLIYLNEIGKSLTVTFKRILRRKWPERYAEDSDEFDFAPLMAVGLTLVFLLFGGLLFDWLEDDWDFMDAFYFSFVSFSTVGFGDLVPSEQGWMLVLILYSMAALSLCAACFTVIQNSLDEFLTNKQLQIEGWYDNWKQHRAAGVSKKDDDATTTEYTWSPSNEDE